MMWILWIGLNCLFPTMVVAFVLNIVMPNLVTFIWGLTIFFKSPFFSLFLLVNCLIYGFGFWLFAKAISYAINQVSNDAHKVLEMTVVFILLFSLIGLPIYGSGSAFVSGSFARKTFWQSLPSFFCLG